MLSKKRKEWHVVNSDLKKDFDTILSIDTGELSSIDRSADDKRWILCFGHDNAPCSYWLYDRQIQKSTFLFQSNKALTSYTLAATIPISFKSRDGLAIQGYLTCPPLHHIQNLPLILLFMVVHGSVMCGDMTI